MDEPLTRSRTIPHPPDSPALSSLPGTGWPAWRWLALLLLAATALRAWQLTHTEVASRDSVNYVRVAWRLGHEDWRVVLRTCGQHPAYPLTVLATSAPVRHFSRGDLADGMRLSAQLAAALAGVLLVVPMFYLGAELFDARVGFWAALLFQCLPPSGRLLGDGLSEPLFLFLCAASLAFACRALRTGWRGSFACAGLAGGLAYLTRHEGALVPLSAGVVLLGMQMKRGWRRPWRDVLACGASLSLPALAVALPYMALIGGLSAKPTAHRLGTHPEHHPGPGWSAPQGGPRAESGGAPVPLTVSTVPWAIWDLKTRNTGERYAWAFYALGVTLVRGSVYVLWVPALFGLVWFGDRFRLVPGAWVALVLSLLLSALL